MSPSLTVNGKPYYGEMKANQMFEGICRGFHEKRKPEICRQNIDALAFIEDIEH